VGLANEGEEHELALSQLVHESGAQSTHVGQDSHDEDESEGGWQQDSVVAVFRISSK
jgi:hypothetical protein